MDIESRKARIDQRMHDAARRAGREPTAVSLLAVSKTRPAADIRRLATLGQKAFGENYLQEAGEKIAQLHDLPLEWHFIGQLQRNKTRVVAETFDWVQSIDRSVIAERLSKQRPADMPDLNLCIQLRMSDEPGKGGADINELMRLAHQIDELPRVRLRGLMTIPENTTDEERLRASFRNMYRLYSTLRSEFMDVDTLSMGMSGDFELAIEEGSSLVRLGTALFGPRDKRR